MALISKSFFKLVWFVSGAFASFLRLGIRAGQERLLVTAADQLTDQVTVVRGVLGTLPQSLGQQRH